MWLEAPFLWLLLLNNVSNNNYICNSLIQYEKIVLQIVIILNVNKVKYQDINGK